MYTSTGMTEELRFPWCSLVEWRSGGSGQRTLVSPDPRYYFSLFSLCHCVEGLPIGRCSMHRAERRSVYNNSPRSSPSSTPATSEKGVRHGAGRDRYNRRMLTRPVRTMLPAARVLGAALGCRLIDLAFCARTLRVSQSDLLNHLKRPDPARSRVSFLSCRPGQPTCVRRAKNRGPSWGIDRRRRFCSHS